MKDLKLYYSISEVAQMFGVTENLLRFWEQEFNTIRPHRAGRDIRQYTKKDIEAVRQVYHYVRECGMTYEGARRAIKHGKGTTVDKTTEVIDRLNTVLSELQSIGREMETLT